MKISNGQSRFIKSRKIVVLAATNHAAKVDPALRRSGRLDRLITIPLPSQKALTGIYKHYLVGVDHALTEDEIVEAASSSIGNTGADVERYVREARRAARLTKRQLSKEDLLAAIYATPPEQTRQPMSKANLENTAWHEAGHAVMCALGDEVSLSEVRYLSIVPRSDGTLGFVAQAPKEGRVSMTAAAGRHRLSVMLAGRAAEEIAFGKEGVTSGCSSDLRTATGLAGAMVAKLGLGRGGKLSVVDETEIDAKEQIEAMLQEAYKFALDSLSAQGDLLMAVAERLLAKSEVSGSEFRSMVDIHSGAKSQETPQ